MASRRGEEGQALSLPHNVEAEAALLGALMIDNRLVEDLYKLQADHFYEPMHGRIFEAILRVVASGRTANPLTLRPLFDADEAMKQVGGPAYLAQLTGSGAAVIGARDFAQQIYDLALLRALISVGRDMVETAMDTSQDIAPLKQIERAEGELYRVAAHDLGPQGKSVHISEGILRTVERVRLIQSGDHQIGATPPDIPEFERVVGPLERGDLIIVAGRPGMGKSGLMTSCSRSMATAGYGQGLLNLEMSEISLGMRFAADTALSYDEPIAHDKIRKGALSHQEVQLLDWCAEQVKSLPLRYAVVPGATLSRLSMRARSLKRELEAGGKTLDVLWVDYLQLVGSDRKFDSRVAEVSEVSKGLKILAQELNCAVVALSQLSRAVEQREDKKPQLSDLRESGSIEQDADTVCFLYREEYYLAGREPDAQDKPREHERWQINMDACRDLIDFIVPKRRAGMEGRAQALYLRKYQAVRARNYWSTAPAGMFSDAP